MTNLTRQEHPNSTLLSSMMLWSLCFIAISPSLGTAVAAIGRLLLYLLALAAFVWRLRQREPVMPPPWRTVSVIVSATCIYMALAILWSGADLGTALQSWSQHARLVSIPVFCWLLWHTGQSQTVLKAYVYAQVFVVLSSWLLVLGVPVPWATGQDASTAYAVFGSYLEQSITQAVLAALLWHLRDSIFGKRGKTVAMVLAVVTLVHTFGFLAGRSGHVVALGLTAMAFFHQLPRRYKWIALLVPFVLLALVSVGSGQFRERMLKVPSEVSGYLRNDVAYTSSGERLRFWRTSLVATAEKPLQGHGTGSWNQEYRRIDHNRPDVQNFTIDNPHQLFLLWAVEGGLTGLALLIATMVSLWLYSRQLNTPYALGMQALIAALVLASLFNSTIYGIGIGDFFCVGIGILASCLPKNSTQEARHV